MKKTWEEARQYCQNLGGDLASVMDGSENERIQKHIARSGIDESLWIGASDKRSEGNFEWSDGKKFSFSNWYPKEPNGQRHENCVHILPSIEERKWNDGKCDNKFGFICSLLS